MIFNRNQFILTQLVTTYRFGREEDEIMGVKFSKEMVLGTEQVVPMVNAKMELTPVQEKLLKKLGPNAFPFTFSFPEMSPSSVRQYSCNIDNFDKLIYQCMHLFDFLHFKVTLQPSDEDQGKPMGVDYCVRTYVGDNEDDKGHKRSSVTLAIKKVRAN